MRRRSVSAATPSSDGAIEPERLLLDQIAAGALDRRLVAIGDAIQARYALIETINS